MIGSTPKPMAVTPASNTAHTGSARTWRSPARTERSMSVRWATGRSRTRAITPP
jgi:hypothetical protein